MPELRTGTIARRTASTRPMWFSCWEESINGPDRKLPDTTICLSKGHMMGILYPLGFEEQKNPALKDGIRHKIQNLRSLKQKTDGASRSSAQIENIKRQSLFYSIRIKCVILKS